MIEKITKQEKEELIERRIEKINLDNKYARELFKTYYKDDPRENMKEWQLMEHKKKVKIVKQIIEWEDKAFLGQGRQEHGMNIPKIMQFVRECKYRQLQEFGIRK